MELAELQVRQWLEQVVVGLNLCPFAATPFRNGQIRIAVNHSLNVESLLAELRSEIELLGRTPATSLETTLIVVADLLSDFEDFNQFLDEVDFLLRRNRWTGTFQIATFHPAYRFEGTEMDAASNLTNRSPWPILHILREDSISQVLADFPDPDAIPERNIQLMESLTSEEKRNLFPWLFSTAENTEETTENADPERRK